MTNRGGNGHFVHRRVAACYTSWPSLKFILWMHITLVK